MSKVEVGTFWKDAYKIIREIVAIRGETAIYWNHSHECSGDMTCAMRETHTQVADTEGTPLEPEREKYVLYPLNLNIDDQLFIRAKDAGMQVRNIYTIGPHTGVMFEGRYCTGYTDHLSRRGGASIPVKDDGNPYAFAIFADPEVKA